MWIGLVGVESPALLPAARFQQFATKAEDGQATPAFLWKETTYGTMTKQEVESHLKPLFSSCVAKPTSPPPEQSSSTPKPTSPPPKPSSSTPRPTSPSPKATSSTPKPTSSPITFKSPTTNQPQSGYNAPALAGGLSAAIIVIIGAAIVAFCCWRRRMQRRRKVVEEFRMSHEKRSSKMSRNEDDGHVDVWTKEHKRRYTEIPQNRYTADNWELPRHRLIVYSDAKLGQGAFGSVYKGKILGLAPAWKYYTQTEMPKEKLEDASVAVKSLPEYADEGPKSDFLQEINFMKSLGYNDHVVCLMGCITRDQPLSLLMEMCSNGDLLHFLRKYKKSGPTGGVVNQPQLRDLLSFAWQICDGMIFLSHKGFIHRDLAARNVLVHDMKIAKIGDFGLCRHVDGDIYTTKGGRLPIKWMAIESLQFYEYTTKSDVWSFGVVLYEIFTLGGVPFSLIEPADMTSHLAEGNRLKQPEHCPDYIILPCMDRPTFEEAREELRRHLSFTTEEYGYFELMERERQRTPTLKSVMENDTNSTSQSDIGPETD